MIGLKPYDTVIEREYCSKVMRLIKKNLNPNERRQILADLHAILPKECFPVGAKWKELVLMPYKDIRRCFEKLKKKDIENACFEKNPEEKIVLKDVYKTYHDLYDGVANSSRKGVTMRVALVRAQEITVCPYCNHDFIGSRGDKNSGAELDHFYPRSEYPFFALSLYNLVPSCGKCNRPKSSAVNKKLISPFDERINWEKASKFVYHPNNSANDKIKIQSKKLTENISKMKIAEAYWLHEEEAQAIYDKRKQFPDSYIKEITDLLNSPTSNIRTSRSQVRDIIFGPEIKQEEFGKIPLGKMKHDLMERLKIYH